MPKLTYFVSTGYVGCAKTEVFDTVKDFNIPDEDWEEMTYEDKDQMFQEWLWNNINADWSEEPTSPGDICN